MTSPAMIAAQVPPTSSNATLAIDCELFAKAMTPATSRVSANPINRAAKQIEITAYRRFDSLRTVFSDLTSNTRGSEEPDI